MSPWTVEVDPRLNETVALQLSADLAQIEAEPAGTIVIDFRRTIHFEPFGMLMAGSAIRRLRQRCKAMDIELEVLTPVDADTGIAGHMGFWRSVGVDVGRELNAPAGRESYLPITRIDIGELYQSTGGRSPLATGVVEAEAKQLSRILCNPYSEALHEALTYALRELIRNVIEHARTPHIHLAGMTWPKRDYVQVAILDEGRGIRQSLADHQEYHFPTDERAIREALRPGTSRNRDRQRSQAELERWADERHVLPLSFFDNSGYGLHMVSTFCREAGQFLVASGSSYLATVGSAEVMGSTLHRGTALRLVVEPSKASDAFDRLFESFEATRSAMATTRPLLSASTLRRLGLDSLTGSDSKPDR